MGKRALHWLQRTEHARCVYRSDKALMLVNHMDELITVVAAGIGNGPFSIVLPDLAQVTVSLIPCSIQVSLDGLSCDEWVIESNGAGIWDSRPDWSNLRIVPWRTVLYEIAAVLRGYQRQHDLMSLQFPALASTSNSLSSSIGQAADFFLHGLQTADPELCLEGARRMIGLGHGLTPCGDDFLLGMLLAAQAGPAADLVATLADEISIIANQETTMLSAAWLQASAHGECSQAWHDFFAAVHKSDVDEWIHTVNRLLNYGHSSGADALSGFVFVLSQLQYSAL